MKTIQISKMLLIFLSAFFLNTASFAEPDNLTLLTNKVKAYHDSGAYHKELNQVIMHARTFIFERVLANKKTPKPEKLAIVLDIDETSLSNYDKMVERDFVATRKQLHEETLAADAPAIEPTLSLYRDALQHGVTVFFITGRHESERTATEKNLKNAGYKEWANLYIRPDDTHSLSIIPFKSQARAAIAKQGYTIIASIGDQQSDLAGGYAEKTFKLPNPYYYLP